MDPSSLVGHIFGPRRFRVCLENVIDFVGVTGDDPERWVEAAPPGFVSAALFVVASDLLEELSDRSVIHGEQTFGWYHQFEMESDLQVEGTVSRVRERGGVSFVNFGLAVGGENGPIADGSAMFLLSGEATAMAGGEGSIEPGALDDGNPGAGQVSASRADLVRYAAATRDWNPIHWDHDSAVGAGVPGVVVHGLLQASWAFAAASRLREGNRPLQSARVRFRNPLPPATPGDVTIDESEGNASVIISRGDTEFVNAAIRLADE